MSLINRTNPQHLLTGLLNRARRLTNARQQKSRRTPRSAAIACGSAVLFFALLHVAVVLVFRYSTAISDPIYHYRAAQLTARVKADPSRIAIVAMGSSRIQNGLVGPVLESTVREQQGPSCFALNFACPGAGPITCAVYLQRMLERGIRPDHLILELFLANMIEVDDRPIEASYLTAERLRPGEVAFLARYGCDADAIREEQARIEREPWQRLRHQFLLGIDSRLLPDGVVMKHSRVCDATGGHVCGVDRYPFSSRPSLTARAKWVFAPVLGERPLSGHACQALEDLLEVCRQRGIAVALIQMPESSEFRSWYSASNRDAFQRFARQIADKHDARLIDARTWMDDADFVDGHHLYDFGAEKFTRRLCAEHMIPMLKATEARPAPESN
jgi:hypothetical protein